MKKIFFVLLFLTSWFSVYSQIKTQADIQKGATTPSSCSVASRNVLFYNTTTRQLLTCGSGNTFEPVGAAGGGISVETVITNENELNTALAAAFANPANKYNLLINGVIPISAPTRTGTVNGYGGATVDGAFSTLSSDLGKDVEITGLGFGGSNIIATITMVINGNAVRLDKNIPVTASPVTIKFIKTFPANATIRQINGGYFTRSVANTSLAVHSPIIADRSLLFKDFQNGYLRINSATDKFYPEWFGATGDARTDASGLSIASGTDDAAALQLMLDSVENSLALNNSTQLSGTFVFGAGKLYRSLSPLIVRKSVVIKGTGGGGESVNTGIWFASNIDGLIFHSSQSENGTGRSYTSDRSVIENIGIFTDSNQNQITHQITITPRPVSNTAPDMFSDVAVQSGETLTSPVVNGIKTIAGMIVRRGGTNYTIVKPTGANLEINPIAANSFVISAPVIVGDYVAATRRFNTLYTNAEYVGGKLKINNHVFTITGRDATGLTLSTTVYSIANNATYNAADVFFTNLNSEEGFYQPPPLATGGALINNKSGIVAYSRISVNGAAIKNFNGDALLFSGSAVNPAGTGGGGYISNNNYSDVRNSLFKSNQGSGTHTYGRNANNISFANNDSTDNKGYGYLDYSDLGCNYYGNHASSSLLGNYRSLSGGVNQSNFYGNYGEIGVVPNFIGQGGLWVGGNDGTEPAFSKYSEGRIETGGVQGSYNASLPARGINSQARALGNPYEQPTITTTFGASNERLPRILTMRGSDDTSGGYQIDYGNGGDGLNGYYTLRNVQNGSGSRTQISDVMLAWSGNAAAIGGRKLVAPNGFYVGVGSSQTYLAPDANGVSADKSFRLINGNVYVENFNNGIILKSPAGVCYSYKAANGGVLTASTVTCP